MTRRKAVRTALILAIIALGVPLSLSQLGSTSDARFGASEQLGPNQLAAATLSVSPGRGTVNLTVVNMTPGDTARGRLDLVNSGSLPLRYALSVSVGTSSPGSVLLADQLQIQIWEATTCGETPPTSQSVLTEERSLGQATVLFGDPETGQDPGDRFIDVGGSDTLCYLVSLPLGTPNGAQSQVVTQSLIVNAEHALPDEPAP